MANPVFVLKLPAGIQRDGTIFSASQFVDGQWCRFYRGLPQKMGGFQVMNVTSDIPRGTFVVNNSPNFNIYIGTPNVLEYFPVDANGGNLGVFVDRTPVAFPTSPNNLWSFDIMYSTVNTSSILVANAPPNLSAIDQAVETPIYYGDALSDTPLVETGFVTSGGIVVLHPFLFFFGNGGEVSWTNANDPTTLMGSARVTATKIVAGAQTRGGNSSPAGLLWSLDSVIRITQVGTTSIEFSFDTVTSQSSILSSKSIIEYDGIYYWAGVDRFLFYNGIVQELPNSMNLQYFFQNLNYAQRQKVWATKYTKYGEIWWFFPGKDANGNFVDECNFAVIYNVREGAWYDTQIQRGSGFYSQTFTKPIWTTNYLDAGNLYEVLRHEVGVDQVEGPDVTPIESYVETSALAWVANGPDGQRHCVDRLVYADRFEPDFLQTGNMTLTVRGKQYANSTDVDSVDYIFSPTTEKIDMREQRREMRLKFHSNVQGGYYQMGQPLLITNTGDVRP